MIETLFKWLDVVTLGNQFASAGIVTSIMVTLGYHARTVPLAIGRFLKRQIVTSVTANNTTYTDRTLFVKLNELLYSKSNQRFTRTFSINSCWDRQGTLVSTLGIGYGHHIAFYRGRVLFVNKMTLESSGGDLLKEQIVITKLGRSATLLVRLLDDLRNHDHADEIAIYDFREEWQLQSHIRKSTLDDIALNPETYHFFKSEIDAFVAGASEFHRLGLPHKLTVALHGEPGTGKTSIIRAIAGTYGMPVCLLNLSMLSDTSLTRAMLTAPKNALIVMEDIDAATSTNSRDLSIETADSAFLTLSGILNALDGIQTLSGNVVFLTTNYLERLDAALLRPGRTDHIVELPYINRDTVKTYFKKLYPTLNTEIIPWIDMPAKDINSMIFQAKTDTQLVLELLTRYCLDKQRCRSVA